jgi:hypothetical protein
MLIFGSLFYTKYMNKTNLGNLVKNPRIFFFFVHSVGLRQQWFGSSGFLIWGLSCEVLSFVGIFYFYFYGCCMDDFWLYPLNDLAKIPKNFESLGYKLKEFTTERVYNEFYERF